MATIHERIKERRTALGMTLARLAELTGVKEATAQRWESGVIKTIRYDTIELLSEVLHCTPQYLMGWDDDITLPQTSPGPSVPLPSPEAMRIARAYDRADEKSQGLVRYALAEYIEPAKEEEAQTAV